MMYDLPTSLCLCAMTYGAYIPFLSLIPFLPTLRSVFPLPSSYGLYLTCTINNLVSKARVSTEDITKAHCENMAPNKKVSQLEHEYRKPNSSSLLTSDFGVREPSHDISLSASVGDRKGPLLMEDNFSREKVNKMIMQNL